MVQAHRTREKTEDAATMNISSAIVYVRRSHAQHVRAALRDIPGVEIHAATEDGRLIVTIEGTSDRDTADAFERINLTEGVLSAALVYHRFESDPAKEA
jgi:nitrate reductase NapD